MKTMIALMSLVIAFTSSLNAQDNHTVNKMLLEGKMKFESAYLNWKSGDMISAKAIFERVLTIDPKNADAMYWNGYAGYRLVIFNLYGKEKNEELAKKYIDEAISVLESAVAADDKNSECYALLGTLTGMKISFNPISGMWLGPKSNGYYDDAIKTNPDNPRAYLLKGLGKMNTPAIFGGGLDKAIQSFEKAITLYKEEKTDSSSIKPDWGYSECHMFLADSYAANGETDKAKDHYNRSLAINPYSQRAKAGLAKLESGK